MRHVLMPLIVLAVVPLVLGGCKKEPKGPQTTELEQPVRTLDTLDPGAGTAGTRTAGTTEPELTLDDTSGTGQDTTGMTGATENGNGGADATAPPPEPETRTYVVQPGDKGFMSIARKLYNNVHRWKEIEALNPDADTRNLRVGQKLTVPAK